MSRDSAENERLLKDLAKALPAEEKKEARKVRDVEFMKKQPRSNTCGVKYTSKSESMSEKRRKSSVV